MSRIREKAVEGLKKGDTFSVTRTFTEADVAVFADISRDYNPVHFDERFTEIKGFSGRICHGLLVASILTEIGGQIGWLASGMNFYFKKPVYPGDTVTCRFTITDIDDRNRAESRAVFTNQDGVTVLEAGLFGIIPHDPEKGILKSILDEGGPPKRSVC